jgi:hypothetical protein
MRLNFSEQCTSGLVKINPQSKTDTELSVRYAESAICTPLYDPHSDLSSPVAFGISPMLYDRDALYAARVMPSTQGTSIGCGG